MRLLSRVLGRAQRRVASRTFLLFALCAALPIATFAGLGYQVVSSQLHEHAARRLNAASKSYGLLLYDRIRQVDSLLTTLGEQYLLGRISLQALRDFSGARARIVGVSTGRVAARSGAAVPGIVVSRSLSVDTQEGDTHVWLSVTSRRAGASIEVTAEFSPDYLWDDDAAALQESTLCVSDAAARPLHCQRSAGSAGGFDPLNPARPDAEASRMLSGEWTLFLRASYAAPAWVIQAYQPREVGLAALGTFRRALPIVAALVIVCAFLLSSIQIRRSHEPLSVLEAAARRIGRRRFDKPLRIDTKDEYGRLARAFNAMGSRLKGQFSLLSMLMRTDRAILSRQATARVIASLLPRLPRLLRCDVAAVLILDDDDSGTLHVSTRLARQSSAVRVNVSRTALAALANERAAPSGRTLDGACAALEPLERIGMTTVRLAPVAIGDELRGALVLGYERDSKRRGIAWRHLLGVAQRIAIAIGNEDRDRTLLQQACFDPLTGLPNRQLFRDRLTAELGRCRDGGPGGAVLFIDIDRFKAVNDSLGHDVGDALLRHVAERFGAVKRDSDTLARFGGDEFVILVPGAAIDAARALAKRLLDALRHPVELQGARHVAEASIGIANYPGDGESAETLLRHADLAMYRAKSAGRNQTMCFDRAMLQDVTRRLQIEQRLRRAMADGQLALHFQPKVRGSDGGIVGVEALARWTDPEGETISPAEFIPIAEETGLIAPLGAWALRSACGTLQAWRERGLDIGHVAVNVSMRQVHDPLFVDFVARCLRDHRLPGECLEIELTESTLSERPDIVAARLLELSRLGVRVAIDDFGTGYSSMTSLRNFPVDVVKVDQSFVRDCATSPDARALVEAIVAVARALGKSIVAEGVENEDQRAVLLALGCEQMQGYLFGRPMPAVQLEEHQAERLRTRGLARSA